MKPKRRSAPADAGSLILPRTAELIDQLFVLAEGVRVVDADGEPAYLRPPDRQAIEYLLNRALGKPAAGTVRSEVNVGGEVMIVLPDNGRDHPAEPAATA